VEHSTFGLQSQPSPKGGPTTIALHERYYLYRTSGATQKDADLPDQVRRRYQIRRFLHFSEQASRMAGLEPQQHQLMLALKGLPGRVRPRIGELAERLQIRHHSTVELVNRLSAGGFVQRHRMGEDRREVWLSLTPKGEKVLRSFPCTIGQNFARTVPLSSRR